MKRLDNIVRAAGFLLFAIGCSSGRAGDVDAADEDADVLRLDLLSPAGSNAAGYIRHDGIVALVAPGADGQLYELEPTNHGMWGTPLNLSAPTGAPSVSGAVFGYKRSSSVSSVVYRSGSNIIEVVLNAGLWDDGNLTSMTSAPTAHSDPMAYVRPDGVPSVVYRSNSSIVEIAYSGGSWNDYNLSSFAVGAPAAAGRPMGYARPDGYPAVVYRSSDNKVIELALNGGTWYPGDLSGSAPAAAGNPMGYGRSDGQPTVVYRSTSNHLIELTLAGGVWSATNISVNSGANDLAGDPWGYVRHDNVSAVVYRDANGDVWEFARVNGSWLAANLTKASAKAKAKSSPMAFKKSSTASSIIYVGTDNNVYEVTLTSGKGWGICRANTSVCPFPTGGGDGPDDGGGRWPAGLVRYTFAGENEILQDAQGNTIAKGPTLTERNAYIAAMNDWRAVTNGVINFNAVASNSYPRLKLWWTAPSAGVSSAVWGYNDCNALGSNCNVHAGASNVYHELAHAIGPANHTMGRYDAAHYIQTRDTAWWNCNNTRTGLSPALNGVDYGPFDPWGTLMYGPTHPDFARWNAAPIIPGATCGYGAPGRQPIGFFSPTCTTCGVTQPGGFPSPLTASAVVEHYTTGGGRKKFLRTVEEDTGAGATLPYRDVMAGATIAPNASPALETWEGGSLAIFSRGRDTSNVDRIYKKFWNTTTSKWEPWGSAFTNPGTSGALSDPAVVSWGSGRSDLVVRRGSTIYIKTYATSAWGVWESLGSPSSTPVSSPAITSWGANRLDVFVRGQDNRLYHRACSANCGGSSGAWSSWAAIGSGTFRGKPAAISRGTGLIEVFVHGLDGELWAVNYQGGAWTNWYKVATAGTLKWDATCPDCCSPAAAARGNGVLDVYVRGLDDKLYVTTWDGGSSWSPYQTLGGVLVSSPATVSRIRSTNRGDVAVVMEEEYTAGTMQSGIWLKKYEP